MSDWLSPPSRTEMLERSVRDMAVHSAISTHREQLDEAGLSELVHEVAHLAVHNALTAFSANIKMEIARIESFERAQLERALLKPGKTFLRDLDQ